jgi:hypothetical protein
MKTTKMNSIVNTSLILPMTVLLIATSLAGPKSDEKERRLSFNATIEGTETLTFPAVGDPDLDDPFAKHVDIVVNGECSGSAKGKGKRKHHLGDFTVTHKFEIDNHGIEGALNKHPGIRTFDFGNGDKLYSVGLGSGTDPGAHPDNNQFVVEEHLIIGGEGRFQCAAGSYTIKRTVFAVRPPDFTDIETLGSIKGVILIPASCPDDPE